MTWRPRSFRLGAMRELITIKRHIETLDEAGQPIVTYATRYADVPAAYDPVTGGETMRGRQVEAGIKAIFTIRRLDNISTQDKVVYGGEDYGITYIRPVEGGKRYLEVYVTQ